MDQLDNLWSETEQRAVELLAAGKLGVQEISDLLGIRRQTLHAWRKRPDFSAKLTIAQAEVRSEIRRHGIALREYRLAALNDVFNRIERVIAERSQAEGMKGVPGGQTGLLVHNVKGVGKGEDFTLVDLYEVDTGTLKELRETAKQAAIELGEWTEKQESETSLTFRHVNDWRPTGDPPAIEGTPADG